jgi:hypothetical protein
MAAKDLEALDDATILRTALSDRRDFGIAPYIDELARRALENPDLLDAACEAVTNGRQLLPRHPAPAWGAGARILDSGNPTAIQRLLSSMDSWSSTEQRDLIDFWAGNYQGEAGIKRLSELYGWSPKI